MKDVYIHGSEGGIQWVEAEGSDDFHSSSTEWSSGVRFRQHPDSQEDVFFSSSGRDVQFAIGDSAGDSLRSKPVELSPDSDQRVFLKAEDDSSSNQKGKRWFTGYTQSK